MHGATPTIRKYPDPIVSSAKMEKPCFNAKRDKSRFGSI